MDTGRRLQMCSAILTDDLDGFLTRTVRAAGPQAVAFIAPVVSAPLPAGMEPEQAHGRIAELPDAWRAMSVTLVTPLRFELMQARRGEGNTLEDWQALATEHDHYAAVLRRAMVGQG